MALCKRHDGRNWQCRQPVMEGKDLCERHFLQYSYRRKHEPVPAALKIIPKRRTKSSIQHDGEYEAPGKNRKEPSKDVYEAVSSSFPRKRGRPSKTEKVAENFNQIEGESKLAFQDGNLHLYQTKPEHENSTEITEVGISSTTKDLKTTSRFKYVESDPVAQELVSSDGDEEILIYNREDEVAVSIPENEVVVNNCKKKFDQSQQLHMIRLLLPIMEYLNQEKINELDTESKNKGTSQAHLQVQLPECSRKPECSFCSSWITDIHRTCKYCSYILCVNCCNELREGYLHSVLGDLCNTRFVRSKSSKISWKFSKNGNIKCPPQNLGGCGQDSLHLTSFYPICFTKDLEENAKHIIQKYKSKIKQNVLNKDLKHFMKHWGKGQPLVIPDVISQDNLNWDFGYLFCKYLESSGGKKSEGAFDRCDVEFSRKQIFMGGKTHENVWQELLRFKLVFSSGFFEEKFPEHFAAVMKCLPVKEYITGFMNLALNGSHENGNPNFGPRVCISYGEPNLKDADFVTNLCCRAYDMVNILVHATDQPISEGNLNKVKVLMNKYNTQDHLKSSKKIRTRNNIEKLFESSSPLKVINDDEIPVSSGESSTEDIDSDEKLVYSKNEVGSSSLDEDEQVVDTHGAEWDIFRGEDIPKLLQYLDKYSLMLSKSCGSPTTVVHPLFDEVFNLDEFHKMRIKEEFNVEPWSFEQKIGEAVIIPAGCPFQMKKIKSCVNVVLDFISPESAISCFNVGLNIRQLPVNHKAKRSMPNVKNMVITGMHTAIEEIRKVSET